MVRVVDLNSKNEDIIKSRFDILLQITFEIAKSAFQLKADIMLVTNSGALVPKATTVKPITKFEIPKVLAKEPAHSTI